MLQNKYYNTLIDVQEIPKRLKAFQNDVSQCKPFIMGNYMISEFLNFTKKNQIEIMKINEIAFISVV
ncbi:4917_t:CDS:2 [Dentiscutata erythropus]|uniref:4917_t:CDS:1 n=1 Tax=Dentiscutata erythropus TaxID=1348616 RepID=A0A9N9B121_9GLOM|nr:4917_t:CDS:2 [Dentiscutata erythropus]